MIADGEHCVVFVTSRLIMLTLLVVLSYYSKRLHAFVVRAIIPCLEELVAWIAETDSALEGVWAN